MKKRNKFYIIFLFLIISLLNYIPNNSIEVKLNQKLLVSNNQSDIKKLTNLVIFIKFSDSDNNVVHHLDDPISVANAEKIYNSDELFEMDSVNGIIKVPSFKKYYEMQSYGSLSITSEIFPKQNNNVISYKDKNPIGYYLEVNDSNPVGYKNKEESLERETQLINRAVMYVSSQIEDAGILAPDIDMNNDGIIDAISFVIEGQNNLPSSIKIGDLLWSHKLTNNGVNNTILGKKVVHYNLLYANDYTQAAGLFSLNRGTYGTIIHEFGHTLGFMDLYRRSETQSRPVGFYDIMGSTIGSNPQDFLTYFISEYNLETNWHNPLPVIKNSTNNITLYKPEFNDKNELRALKIETGNNSEHFIVEYYDRKNTYDSYRADASGLIVYRVNEKNKYYGVASTSSQSQNDHIYVFRPNETNLGNGFGNLEQATLNNNRPKLGKSLDASNSYFDNETIYYANGENSGVMIEITGQTDNSITFNVVIPETLGSGTVNDPYLIYDTYTFLRLMRLDTKDKYYKLMSDLDFKYESNYPNINFYGNLDGNYKVLKNINSNGSGVFSDIGGFTKQTSIKNLTVENIIAYSDARTHLGGFANGAYNVTLENIRLKSGSVTNASLYDDEFLSTGGLLGSSSNNTSIIDCSSSLDITAKKNVGGLIGINSNAMIKNSFANGSIKGDYSVGGVIGIQSIMDDTYNLPQNVYYYKAGLIDGVGGYARGFHNLNILDINSLSNGIVGISIPSNITVAEGENVDYVLDLSSNVNIPFSVVVDNPAIIRYENKKIYGLKEGNTNVYTKIEVGNGIMLFSSKVIVNAKSTNVITEKDILDYLGLFKQDKYVIGFRVGTDVANIIKDIMQFNGITLENFTNSFSQDISSGPISTGMVFTINFNGTNKTYTSVVKGDVNGDGYIYATDYVKIKNHIMGKSKLDGASLIAADVNSDGYIYATDYVKIRNYIMGKDQNI